MNRQSIFFTITVSFIISIILVVLSFIILMIANQKALEHHLFERYKPISQMMFRQHFKKGAIDRRFIESLNSLNFKVFTKKGPIDGITYNPKTKVIAQRRFRNEVFRVLKLDGRQFLYMKRKGDTFLVEDRNDISKKDMKIYIILGFAVISITLILSFIITIRKLMPLKILKDKVSTLADENFDFECCNTNRKDEVSLLAVEFKNTAKKLKDLKEARNVFIRNIMHELKTPITKGKFLAEIEKSEENNDKLKEVFNRLESLINEFASIEELISSTKNIEKKTYYLNDVVDNAKDILMVDENEVIEKFENKKLNINFKLFSIAIKNLIDNAIKYSSNKQVTIKTEDENIIFENNGDKLEYELEKYYEPFFANEDKSKNSFGLGLYITYNILKANNYILEYEYTDGKNVFKCRKKDEE